MPKTQPTINLKEMSDVDLLQAVTDILLRDRPISPSDREELDLINQEFLRRDSLTILPK